MFDEALMDSHLPLSVVSTEVKDWDWASGVAAEVGFLVTGVRVGFLLTGVGFLT